MNAFSVIFLVALILATGLRLWLAQRQIRHVHEHRSEVPASFRDRISSQAHARAADYTVARTRLGRVEGIYDSALLVGWTLGGGLAALDAVWTQAGLGALAHGTLVVISALLVMAILELPFSIYHTFVIEQRFGFNRMTAGLFAADLLKQGLVMLVLLTPLLWVILWLMDSAPRWWWLYGWAVWLAFTLTVTWAYPRVIAPLFNRFSALQDPELRRRIEALLDKCGFSSNGVFVMDGSRRSTHGNAYFTGIGDNKRIVFFDTLLDTLEPPEVEAVLAHELGHFRLRHIRKRMLVMAALTLAGFALLGWLEGQAWFYAGLGVTPSDHMALLLFMMVGPVFGFFLQPIGAYFSRRHEYEADDYASRQSDPAALVHALTKLYEENASTLTPDPVYSRFYDSHPPALARIHNLSQQAGA